jgi:hypothetical protein
MSRGQSFWRKRCHVVKVCDANVVTWSKFVTQMMTRDEKAIIGANSDAIS